jgi:CBS domain containing-hemolysin-like protein
MQRDRRQVTVVLDEFGGTAGIATLDDLLADLVEETFETAPFDGSQQTAHPAVMEVEGSAAVGDVAQQFGVTFTSDAETIGGLLSSAVGRIPAAGERFELAGLEFDVVAATPTKVERVTVRRPTGTVIKLESASGQ